MWDAPSSVYEIYITMHTRMICGAKVTRMIAQPIACRVRGYFTEFVPHATFSRVSNMFDTREMAALDLIMARLSLDVFCLRLR